MRHRYPFEALHWLRRQRADRKASVLAESARRAAEARNEAARAEAARAQSEQKQRALSAAEQLRLDEGLARALDLSLVADWQKGAAVELAAKAEREQRAREAHASEAAAEAAARRALSSATSEMKLIEGHRDAFQAQRAKSQQLREEEAAAEQWTASHFPVRRS